MIDFSGIYTRIAFVNITINYTYITQITIKAGGHKVKEGEEGVNFSLGFELGARMREAIYINLGGMIYIRYLIY